jgi:two-component system, chemotaxis family, sensor kinase CheA
LFLIFKVNRSAKPKRMNEEFKIKFIEDASDLIHQIEQDLLLLEQNPDEREILDKIFRGMHSIKGASGMYGFDQVSEMTHQLEALYDQIRNGKVAVTRDVLDFTLKAADHLKKLFQTEGCATDTITHKNFIREIKRLQIKSEQQTHFEALEAEVLGSKSSTIKTWYITFAPDADIAGRGINLSAIFEELEKAGTCKMFTHEQEDAANKFYMWWEILLATQFSIEEIRGIFVFVEEEYKIQQLSEKDLLSNPEFVKSIDDIYESGEVFNFEELATIAQELDREKQQESAAVVAENLLAPAKTSSIRVSSFKLDDLMNLVSELVTTQAELSLLSTQQPMPRLVRIAENVEKLSRRLRDNAFSICLVPIKEMLIRFQRLVRDLSKELGKDIDFVAEGIDTELDKNIIDSLGDPLVHIIRNCIDHGIELPAERIKKGKPAKGTIHFKAFHSGTNVVIKVIDDGAGINSKKVRQKAIEKGLISEEDFLSEKEIINLIFRPGFTTSEQVSAVSGRGVGMDVVARQISAMRGEVDIDTEANKGTTMTLRLPLTLSIVDALLVKTGPDFFLVPLDVITKCSEETHLNIQEAVNNRLIIDGELIPLVNLRQEFSINGNIPKYEQLIVIKNEEKPYALVVDDIIGEHQAVLKPIGDLFVHQDFVSGASILGDGSVALVLDTHKLIKGLAKI